MLIRSVHFMLKCFVLMLQMVLFYLISFVYLDFVASNGRLTDELERIWTYAIVT